MNLAPRRLNSRSALGEHGVDTVAGSVGSFSGFGTLDDVTDIGNLNGTMIDSPTVNSYVVGVEIVPPSPPPVTGLPGPRPTIASISPEVGIAGGVFTMRVYGSNYSPEAQVNVGGRPARYSAYIGPSELETEVHSDGIALGTRIPVSVIDVTGESPAVEYTFGHLPSGPAPTITSIDPTEATPPAAFTLHIHGTGYTPAVQVWADGAAQNTGYVSATQVDTAVDLSDEVGPRDADIWVNDVGGESNHVTFRVLASE